MKVMHRVTIEADRETRREFDRLNLEVGFHDGRGNHPR
jgi:hypothetical protein